MEVFVQVGSGVRGLWLVAVLACSLACTRDKRDDDPAQVVERFVAAVTADDRAAAAALLGPRTRARLEEAMRSAERVSGRVVLEPHDFLSVGRAPPAWEMATVRTVHEEDARATVEVSSATGDRHPVELVRVPEGWRIELPGT
jgi:hypothetical protein